MYKITELLLYLSLWSFFVCFGWLSIRCGNYSTLLLVSIRLWIGLLLKKRPIWMLFFPWSSFHFNWKSQAALLISKKGKQDDWNLFFQSRLDLLHPRLNTIFIGIEIGWIPQAQIFSGPFPPSKNQDQPTLWNDGVSKWQAVAANIVEKQLTPAAAL